MKFKINSNNLNSIRTKPERITQKILNAISSFPDPYYSQLLDANSFLSHSIEIPTYLPITTFRSFLGSINVRLDAALPQ